MRERLESYARHLISSSLGDACAKGMHYNWGTKYGVYTCDGLYWENVFIFFLFFKARKHIINCGNYHWSILHIFNSNFEVNQTRILTFYYQNHKSSERKYLYIYIYISTHCFCFLQRNRLSSLVIRTLSQKPRGIASSTTWR